MAENTVRTAMHPADQLDAFHAMHTKQGIAAEDIAARFGVKPAVVKQRPKLAAVSAELLSVYRKAGMTLDQLTAFAITDDVAAQVTPLFSRGFRKLTAVHPARQAHIREQRANFRMVTQQAVRGRAGLGGGGRSPVWKG